jgi:hypothetical protein
MVLRQYYGVTTNHGVTTTILYYYDNIMLRQYYGFMIIWLLALFVLFERWIYDNSREAKHHI